MQIDRLLEKEGFTRVLVHNGDIERVGPHEVGPYGEVGGHHPHQQAARSNNSLYNAMKAIAVKDGTYNHAAITRTQVQLNAEAARSGAAYDLQAEEVVQRKAMRSGGFTDAQIDRILEKSREVLKRQGALEPTRIPGTRKSC